MCTAVTYRTKDHYFGRNLDLEYAYGEAVTVAPRRFALSFRSAPEMKAHYAMIGMAHVTDGYPLYYDATNEKGLSIAGLNFPGNAHYSSVAEGKDNIASFELIPWLLGQCADLHQARELLGTLNLIDESFRDDLPPTPLHWLISDAEGSIVLESVREGIRVYENPVGVLTNNPAFDMQMFNLNNYLHLTCEIPENTFSSDLKLERYSRGMGAMGLPGDLSSMSRFVRAAFARMNARSGAGEAESVSQFFHILSFVEQPRGLVHMGGENYEITRYSSCCNTDQGIYYYKTYDNSGITAVDMHRENLNSEDLAVYPLILEGQIHWQNGN